MVCASVCIINFIKHSLETVLDQRTNLSENSSCIHKTIATLQQGY